MPRIFDNIQQHFLPALEELLHVSEHADSCAGDLNRLRFLNSLVVFAHLPALFISLC